MWRILVGFGGVPACIALYCKCPSSSRHIDLT
jgi:hypothetical protein